LYKSAPVTINPPAHCSSPEDNASDRMAEDLDGFDDTGRPKTTERQVSSESLPESMNPFLTLSSEDFKGMDKEVEDILSNESSSSSNSSDEEGPPVKEQGGTNYPGQSDHEVKLSESSESCSSEPESLTAEYPKGRKRKHILVDNGGAEGDDEEDEMGEGGRDGDDMARFKRGEIISDDYEIADASDDDDDDIMGKQMEMELLGEDSLSNLSNSNL